MPIWCRGGWGDLSVSSFSLHWFTFMLLYILACMKGNLRSWVYIDREGGGVIILLSYMYSNLSFFNPQRMPETCIFKKN